MQVALVIDSPVSNTGLKSNVKFSDSVEYLYENWLICLPFFAVYWLIHYEVYKCFAYGL